MALLHQADLRPTKLELLTYWLPTQSWHAGETGTGLERVAAYRFDDPDGEVGVETLLVRTDDGPVIQVPLTYRAAPLAGADDHLVGTMDHSVLGKRWAYDGCGDPIYVRTLLHAMLTGGRQADLRVETDRGLERRDPDAVVRGSGGSAAPAMAAVRRYDSASPATIVTNEYEITVARVVPGLTASDGSYTLTGRWPGQDSDVCLATATTR